VARTVIVLLLPENGVLPPSFFDPTDFLISLDWSLLRCFVTFLICFGLGLVSLKILDKITPKVERLERIKGHPLPTALYAAGMFMFLSLTFIGSVSAPLPIGLSSGLGSEVSAALTFVFRFTTLLAGFITAIILTLIFYEILDRVKPFGINLDDVNKDPMAIGVYVMGYLIFLGVILYMSLLIPV